MLTSSSLRLLARRLKKAFGFRLPLSCFRRDDPDDLMTNILSPQTRPSHDGFHYCILQHPRSHISFLHDYPLHLVTSIEAIIREAQPFVSGFIFSFCSCICIVLWTAAKACILQHITHTHSNLFLSCCMHTPSALRPRQI